MLHNEIMLIGNVKVIDGTTILTCDRLTVFLKSDDTKVEKKTDPANDFGDSSAMLKGISRILADGDVLLKRRPENLRSGNAAQYARAEQLEYEFDSGRIILTGEDELPTLTQDNYSLCGKRIELLRFSRKAFVKGSCKITEFSDSKDKKTALRTITSNQADFDGVANLNVFSGNVTVTDNDAVLKCDRMRVFLKPVNADQKLKEKNQEFSPVSGAQDLDRIFCEGNVSIVSIPKAAKMQADKKSKQQLPSTLNARRAELNYRADKLVFYDDVRINHQGDTLNCERLDLFLKDSAYPEKKNEKSSGGVALGGKGANDKTLSKVIASGKVTMKDHQSDLSTELMTLDFKELPPGTSQTPGMFAAGSVQLIRIACDGKVVASSFPGTARTKTVQKRMLKAEHAMSDLLKNRSEFHKNVQIMEENNTLSCSNMYVFTGAAPEIKPAAAVTATTPEDDPDADPFALPATENTAPSRIALSDGIDLERIVCKNQVVLANKDKKGEFTYAGGDTAIYTVKTGEIVITADAPSRPYLRRDGRIQYSDIIQGNLQTEELSGSGNVQVVTDKSEKKE